jgi:hypothetical protein
MSGEVATRGLSDWETNHLLRGHHDRLDGELPATEVEQILETWAQQVDDENVV